MAEWLEPAISFFKDKTVHLSYRISLFIVGVVILLAVNDLSGFTRNLLINRKLEQIKELQVIDSSIVKRDTAVSRRFKELKNEIVNEQSYIGSWYRFYSKTNGRTTVTKPSGQTNKPAKYDVSRDRWYNATLWFLTYFGIGIFIGFGVPYSIFYSKDDTKTKLTTVAGIFILLPVMYCYGWVYKYIITSLVPIYYDKIWINYIVNVAGQVLITYLLYYAEEKFKKSRLRRQVRV